MTRGERIEQLEQFYCGHLVEDGRDGSEFDNAILDALADIKRKFVTNAEPLTDELEWELAGTL